MSQMLRNFRRKFGLNWIKNCVKIQQILANLFISVTVSLMLKILLFTISIISTVLLNLDFSSLFNFTFHSLTTLFRRFYCYNTTLYWRIWKRALVVANKENNNIILCTNNFQSHLWILNNTDSPKLVYVKRKIFIVYWYYKIQWRYNSDNFHHIN